MEYPSRKRKAEEGTGRVPKRAPVGNLVGGSSLGEDRYHRWCVLGMVEPEPTKQALYEAVQSVVPFEVSVAGSTFGVNDPDIKRYLWDSLYGPITLETACKALANTFKRFPHLMKGQYYDLLPPELRREIFSYIGRGPATSLWTEETGWVPFQDVFVRLLLLSMVYKGSKGELAVVTDDPENGLILYFRDGKITIFPSSEGGCGWLANLRFYDRPGATTLGEIGVPGLVVSELPWLEERRLQSDDTEYLISTEEAIFLIKLCIENITDGYPMVQLTGTALEGLVSLLEAHGIDDEGLYDQGAGSAWVLYRQKFIPWIGRVEGVGRIMADSNRMLDPKEWCQ